MCVRANPKCDRCKASNAKTNQESNGDRIREHNHIVWIAPRLIPTPYLHKQVHEDKDMRSTSSAAAAIVDGGGPTRRRVSHRPVLASNRPTWTDPIEFIRWVKHGKHCRKGGRVQSYRWAAFAGHRRVLGAPMRIRYQYARNSNRRSNFVGATIFANGSEKPQDGKGCN